MNRETAECGCYCMALGQNAPCSYCSEMTEEEAQVYDTSGPKGLREFVINREDMPPTSQATSTNPKDLQGAKKVSTTKLPAIAILHGAHAMMDGARKYDPYNWRAKSVVASIYIDAATRHLLAWFEGEQEASDSNVHHLGHALACCAIILDAEANGNLIDDRPKTDRNTENYTRTVAAIMEKIKNMKPIAPPTP